MDNVSLNQPQTQGAKPRRKIVIVGLVLLAVLGILIFTIRQKQPQFTQAPADTVFPKRDQFSETFDVAEAPSNWQTYINKNYQYRFAYP